MSEEQVFGAYYFESAIVTSESYTQLLTNYLLPMLLSLTQNIVFSGSMHRHTKI